MSEQNKDTLIETLKAELRIEAQRLHTEALTMQGMAQEKEKRSEELFRLGS